MPAVKPNKDPPGQPDVGSRGTHQPFRYIILFDISYFDLDIQKKLEAIGYTAQLNHTYMYI